MISFRSSVSRIAYAYAVNRLPGWRIPPSLRLQVPQADNLERRLKHFAFRDWRSTFAAQLQGKGIEIGPLHRPMVRHPGMQLDYIDRFTTAQLREHYPELRNLDIVEPTIIGDAETFAEVQQSAYDFVIAAHVIEHMRSPLAALSAWCTALKPGGLIYLVVPDKRMTFDYKRTRTALEHILLDYLSPSRERDFEHFLEFAVHAQGASGQAAVEQAKKLQEMDYSIHFHTFIPSDMLNLLDWFSANVRPLKIVNGPAMRPGEDEFHLLVQVQ